MKKNFIISVIIPVYNVEQYIEETINSVINQTIGFNNIQLILVNDGSIDNSEKICLKYKDLYSNNIVYIKQKNSGVSSARNKGLKYVEGEYVNFLDSDDLWEKDAFERGIKLFKKNSEINAVIYPLKFFEASKKQHPLNIMFKKTCVVDIRKDYQYIKLSSCSTLFKTDVLKERKFSNKLKVSEDVRLLTEIFLDHPIIGIVSNSMYYYRKRITNSSTIQTSSSKKTWYMDTPKHCYQYIINLSKKKYGKVIKYVQYLLTYDLHWRMSVKIAECLNETEKNEYLKMLHGILKEIDDEIIVSFPIMSFIQKIYMLSFKHQNQNIFSIQNNNIYVNNIEFDMKKGSNVYIDNIVVDNDNIDIYGRLFSIPKIFEEVYLETNKDIIKFDFYELDSTNGNNEWLDDNYKFNVIGLHAKVNLENKNIIQILLKNENNSVILNPVFTYSSILNNQFSSIYLRTKKHYLKYVNKHKKIVVYRKNIKNKILLESNCLLNLVKSCKYKSLFYRVSADGYRLFKRKDIWLVSDRIQVAGDNGEAFFHYLMKKKDKKINSYFVLSDKASSYNDLKNKYPKNIIKHGSLKHKILHLNADKIISAQADNYVTNLFGQGKYYIGDLYRFKFVFLQHGITKDDLSPWLNINSKTINLFITAANSEYDSIINGKYHYNFPMEWIKLTGFARYDKLIDNKKTNKTIVIMPTWRKYLVSSIDPKNGSRIYDSSFKETKYFKFYNNLINDPRLLDHLKKKGYKIRFIPHVNMMHQVKDFDVNSLVEIVKDNIDYCEEFKNNSLLVTDYSSVFFDFGYLNKPIVYSQFDQDIFFSGQIYDKGYFSYERDGFGPICNDIDTTVNEIIKLINQDCKIDNKYLKRINKFYKFHDQNNCERIYQCIKELNKF